MKNTEPLAHAELRKTDSKSSAFTDREKNIITLAEKVMGWSVVPWANWNRWELRSRREAKDFSNVAVLMEGHVYPVVDGHGNAPTSWNPYESIADAWLLVAKLRTRHEVQRTTQAFSFQLCQTGRPGGWHCSFAVNEMDWSQQAYVDEAPTACEAICTAALATLEKGEVEHGSSGQR